MNTKINLSFVVVLALYGPALGFWSEPEPVTEINSDYHDKAPFLSFDGLTLYFSRQDGPGWHYARIYQATRPEPEGQFTSVQEISNLNYSGGHVDHPWVSPDNLRMYYNRTEPGSRWRLKVTERASINDPWQPGVNISELNVLGDFAQLSLTEDELTIVFTGYNLAGSQDKYDLWMATRPDKDSLFGNVTELTELNSNAGDAQPYITPDGLSLYFASDRNGVGQLFKATRESLDASFGPPEHLSFFDTLGGSSCYPSLSSDGMALYFSRWPNGGMLDIYVSYIPEPATLLLLGLGGVLARGKKH